MPRIDIPGRGALLRQDMTLENLYKVTISVIYRIHIALSLLLERVLKLRYMVIRKRCFVSLYAAIRVQMSLGVLKKKSHLR